MNHFKILPKAAVILALFHTQYCHAFSLNDAERLVGHVVGGLVSQAQASTTTELPAQGKMEVAFSPNAGAEGLVVKVINSARSGEDLLVMGYSFTSAPVSQALIRAAKRGAHVKAVVDYKANVTEDRFGKSRAALSAMLNAGADVRTIDAFAIAHDKVIVAGKNVQTGSFNYTSSAQSRNSENVLVVWNAPELAKAYTSHFQRNYDLSKPFRPGY